MLLVTLPSLILMLMPLRAQSDDGVFSLWDWPYESFGQYTGVDDSKEDTNNAYYRSYYINPYSGSNYNGYGQNHQGSKHHYPANPYSQINGQYFNPLAVAGVRQGDDSNEGFNGNNRRRYFNLGSLLGHFDSSQNDENGKWDWDVPGVDVDFDSRETERNVLSLLGKGFNGVDSSEETFLGGKNGVFKLPDSSNSNEMKKDSSGGGNSAGEFGGNGGQGVGSDGTSSEYLIPCKTDPSSSKTTPCPENSKSTSRRHTKSFSASTKPTKTISTTRITPATKQPTTNVRSTLKTAATKQTSEGGTTERSISTPKITATKEKTTTDGWTTLKESTVPTRKTNHIDRQTTLQESTVPTRKTSYTDRQTTLQESTVPTRKTSYTDRQTTLQESTVPTRKTSYTDRQTTLQESTVPTRKTTPSKPTRPPPATTRKHATVTTTKQQPTTTTTKKPRTAITTKEPRTTTTTEKPRTTTTTEKPRTTTTTEKPRTTTTTKKPRTTTTTKKPRTTTTTKKPRTTTITKTTLTTETTTKLTAAATTTRRPTTPTTTKTPTTTATTKSPTTATTKIPTTTTTSTTTRTTTTKRTTSTTTQPTTTAATTTVSTTLQPSTTLKPVVPEICQGSDVVDGVGYKKHWSDCSKFIQCVLTPEGSTVVFLRTCTNGTVWDQATQSCAQADLVDCPEDPCKMPGLERYPSATNCASYWICKNGKSRSACCPPRHSYDNIRGCVPDPQCLDECNNGPIVQNVCDRRAVQNKPLMFEQYTEGQGWTLVSCAPGTVYNQITCQCSGLDGGTAPNIECQPELYIPFNGDIKDESGNNNYLQVDGVKVVDGTGYFDGKSLIRVPRFSNLDFGDTVIIKLRYREDGGGKVEAVGLPQALVANGDCNNPSSLYLVTDHGQLDAGLRTQDGRSTSVSVPSNGTDWKEAVLMVDKKVLLGALNGISYETLFTGSIEPSKCALQIGRGTEFAHFHGYMDDVTVYLCKPKGF